LLDPAGGVSDLAVGQRQPGPQRRHRVEQADHRGAQWDPFGLADRLQGAGPAALGVTDPGQDRQSAHQLPGPAEPPGQRHALSGVVQGGVQLAALVVHLGHAHMRDACGRQRVAGLAGDS
jgi:hypothetical protein